MSWLRRQRKLLIVLPFVLVTLVSTWAIGAVASTQRQQARDQDKAVERQVEACHERAADRDVLRTVVDVSTSSGARDLTKVEGFAALDPLLQTYLVNLSIGPPTPADQPSLHDKLLKLLPPIDCTEVEALLR